MADTIKYLGKSGEYLITDDGALPARDLTTDDYKALTNAQRATVRKSGLYDYASYKDATATTSPAADAPPQAEQAAADVPPSVTAAEAAPVEPVPAPEGAPAPDIQA